MPPTHSTLLRSCAYYYARGYVPYEEYRAFRRQVIKALISEDTPPKLPESWTHEPEPEQSFSSLASKYQLIPSTAVVLSVALAILVFIISLALLSK